MPSLAPGCQSGDENRVGHFIVFLLGQLIVIFMGIFLILRIDDEWMNLSFVIHKLLEVFFIIHVMVIVFCIRT